MRNERLFLFNILVILFISIVIFVPKADAQSAFVLPYPSAMPGSVFYKINLVKESLQKYWYFGDFAKFKYNLRYSNKYLIEAKILYEYNQYLLASKALEKSNGYFEKIIPSLLSAKARGKDTSENRAIVNSASKKHIEELVKLIDNLPTQFLWENEFSDPILIEIHTNLNLAIKLRESL